MLDSIVMIDYSVSFGFHPGTRKTTRVTMSSTDEKAKDIALQHEYTQAQIDLQDVFERKYHASATYRDNR